MGALDCSSDSWSWCLCAAESVVSSSSKSTVWFMAAGFTIGVVVIVVSVQELCTRPPAVLEGNEENSEAGRKRVICDDTSLD